MPPVRRQSSEPLRIAVRIGRRLTPCSLPRPGRPPTVGARVLPKSAKLTEGRRAVGLACFGAVGVLREVPGPPSTEARLLGSDAHQPLRAVQSAVGDPHLPRSPANVLRRGG